MNYDGFLHGKVVTAPESGMDVKPEELSKKLKPHQRDAAVKQLRKIADCSTCRKDRPEGVDGPECVACTRGQNWEWDEGAEMR